MIKLVVIICIKIIAFVIYKNPIRFIFYGWFILINLLIKKISGRYFAGDPFVLIKILKEMIKFIILKYILIMLKIFTLKNDGQD